MWSLLNLQLNQLGVSELETSQEKSGTNEKLNFSQMDLLKFYENKSKRRDLVNHSIPYLSKSQTHKKMSPVPGAGEQKGCSVEDPRLWVGLEGRRSAWERAASQTHRSTGTTPALGGLRPASNLLKFLNGSNQSVSAGVLSCLL